MFPYQGAANCSLVTRDFFFLILYYTDAPMDFVSSRKQSISYFFFFFFLFSGRMRFLTIRREISMKIQGMNDEIVR